MRVLSAYVAAIFLIVFGIVPVVSESVTVAQAQAQQGEAPSFQVDPSWPETAFRTTGPSDGCWHRRGLPRSRVDRSPSYGCSRW